MNLISIILVSFISIFSTFYLSVHLKQGSVRASAGLSLLFALIMYNFPIDLPEDYRYGIPVVFFGASFMGMVSKEIMNTWYFFLFSSVVFALVFYLLADNFKGYGGGLGMQACISIIAVLGFDYLWFISFQWFKNSKTAK